MIHDSYFVSARSLAVAVFDIHLFHYFIEVISYVEVNDLKNVNLNFSLSKCVHQIVDLADSNKHLMMLSSKYKVIREEITNLINLDEEE